MAEKEEGTTLDVPALAQLEQWRTEAERRGELAPAPDPRVRREPPVASPQVAPAPAAVQPVSAPIVNRSIEHGADAAAPLTDWMRPEEIDAALREGKPAPKPQRFAPPSTMHSQPAQSLPSWIIPAIAVAAFVVLFGGVALVLLFAT